MEWQLAVEEDGGTMTPWPCPEPEWLEAREVVLLFERFRNSEMLVFTGTSGLAAIVETRLGRFIACVGSDLSLLVADEVGEVAVAAVTIDGAEPSEEAIGRANGRGGTLESDLGALLRGNG